MFLQDSGTILQTLRAGVRGAAAMNGTNGGLAARAAAWRQAGQDELVARLARAIRAEGTVEPMKGVRDASHFTRDYKRLFGAPPLRDVERLRGAAKESAGL
jgi:hypothetical protein